MNPLRKFALLSFFGITFFALGCADQAVPTTPPTVQREPVVLSISGVNDSFSKSLVKTCESWASRRGDKIVILPPGSTTAPDVTIIRAEELGSYAERGEASQMPVELRSGESSVRWTRLLRPYSETLCCWAGQSRSIPVAGEAYLLVTRFDRLEERRQQIRTLNPTTWEEIADIAEVFRATEKKQVLQPLRDPRRLLRTFHQIAACYDRETLTDRTLRTSDTGKIEGEKTEGPKARSHRERAISFHIDSVTLKHRIDTAGFRAAMEWLHRTAPCRSLTPNGSDDPIEALEKGETIFAILSLEEIGRLPRDSSGEISKKYQLSPMPMTQKYLEADGKVMASSREGNYVPYFGSEARLGIVSPKSAHAKEAWELLSHLTSTSVSLTALGDPTSAPGPFRSDHIDQDNKHVWFAYGFDKIRSATLDQAIRTSMATATINPAMAMRTPDREAKMKALELELRAVAEGRLNPEEALRKVADAWNKLDDAEKPDTLAKWRRHAINLE